MSTYLVWPVRSQPGYCGYDKYIESRKCMYISLYSCWVNYSRVRSSGINTPNLWNVCITRSCRNSGNISTEGGTRNDWTKSSNPFISGFLISEVLQNAKFHSLFYVSLRSFILNSKTSLRFSICSFEYGAYWEWRYQNPCAVNSKCHAVRFWKPNSFQKICRAFFLILLDAEIVFKQAMFPFSKQNNSFWALPFSCSTTVACRNSKSR